MIVPSDTPSEVPAVFQFDSIQVRTVAHNGEYWFVASDVCSVLNIGNPSMAVSKLDADEVTLSLIEGSHRDTNIVNESGLYSLIMTSRKPEAKRFKKWVTSEVLPTLRKQGSYSMESPEQLMARALVQAQQILELKDKQIEEMQPKALAYDMLLGCKNSMTMGEVAKALGWGRNSLFAMLRCDNILMKDNLPYQKYIDAGYFKVRYVTVEIGVDTETKAQTLVTAKGLNWLATLNVEHMKARKRLLT